MSGVGLSQLAHIQPSLDTVGSNPTYATGVSTGIRSCLCGVSRTPVLNVPENNLWKSFHIWNNKSGVKLAWLQMVGSSRQVRNLGFHPSNTGSNPVPTTKNDGIPERSKGLVCKTNSESFRGFESHFRFKKKKWLDRYYEGLSSVLDVLFVHMINAQAL